MRFSHLAKVLGCGLVWASMAGVALAQAGMDADGPPPAFAGGQMVRGTVTAVAADHLTLKTETGETYQVSVSVNTRIRKGRDPLKTTDVHPGDGVGAMGVLDAPTKTVHAMMIQIVDAEQIRKAREAMGKTYIAGKVAAIDMDALKITVLRADGVTQTIGLDDDTSFKRGGRGIEAMAEGMGGAGFGGGGGNGGQARSDGQGRPGGQSAGGGESITLADLKVGDTIGGPGALKSGVFVPTELRVATPAPPGGQRRRRQQGAGDGAGSPPPNAGSSAEPKG